MNTVILGAPGSGKGTLASKLEAQSHSPHISTGNIVRAEIAAKTSFGLKISNFNKMGQLLPDTPEYMGHFYQVISKRLSQDDCQNGYFLDGTPRTFWQVGALEEALTKINRPVETVIHLQASRNLLLGRLTGRLICRSCNLSYHKLFSPPKTLDRCDSCRTSLVRRDDDHEEVAIRRLDDHFQTIDSILEAYKKTKNVIEVDGEAPSQEVLEAVNQSLYPRNYLQKKIASYPSPTKKGVQIYNLIEIYKNPQLITHIVGRLTKKIQTLNPNYIVSPEARALPIFGALVNTLGKPGIFLRKVGKIPGDNKISVSYKTAYSTDSLEMAQDSSLQNKTAVIVDDGISSGGTILAAIKLLENAGVKVIGILTIVEYHYSAKAPEYHPWKDLTQTLFDLK